MPTFNQLVRKGRKVSTKKSNSPALQYTYNSLNKKLAAREDLGELGIVAHAGGLTAAGGELRGGAFHHAAPTAQDAPHLPEPEDEKGGGAHGGDQPGDPRRHRLQLLFLQILSLEPSIAIFPKNGKQGYEMYAFSARNAGKGEFCEKMKKEVTAVRRLW